MSSFEEVGLNRERLLRQAWVWDLSALAFLALHAALAWVLRDPGVLTGQDDAHYLILAESLKDFQYRDLFRVDAPLHSRYPPVFPAILAGWSFLVGGRFDDFIALNIAFATAALAVFYRAVARVWSRPLALACLAPSALIAEQVLRPGILWSESAYAFFSLLALGALAGPSATAGRTVLAGAGALLAALTRSIGVTLVAAVAVPWILERRKVRAGVFLGAAAMTVGAWLLWTALAPEQHIGRSYMRDLTLAPPAADSPGLLATLVSRVLTNSHYYLSALGYHLAAPNLRGTGVDNLVVGALLIALIGWGVLELIRQWRPAALYLPFYGGVLLLWPWLHGRFLFVVLPLLFLATLLGLGRAGETLTAWWGRSREGWEGERAATGLRASRVVMAAFALASTAWGSARTASVLLEKRTCPRSLEPPGASCLPPDVASYFQALAYIERRTPPAAVLLSVTPEPTYYYTERRSPPLDDALQQHREGFLPFLRAFGTDYVLLGSLQPADVGRLTEQLEASCSELALERAFPPRTFLFRVRERGEARAEDGCQAVAEAKRANLGRNFARGP
jgi:hypothetical protein